MAGHSVPLDVVFCFDITGSIAGCMDEVKEHVTEMIQRLYVDIPDMRVSIFAHGHKCDISKYVIKQDDFIKDCDRNNHVARYGEFTDDMKKLYSFRNEAGPFKTLDGSKVCAEGCRRVFGQVRGLLWRAGVLRTLVMIGDSKPRESDFPADQLSRAWREGAELLAQHGIQIYGVNFGDFIGNQDYYREISGVSGGQYLELSDIKLLPDFLMAVCYKQKGSNFLDKFEEEVKFRPGPAHKDLNKLFTILRGEPAVELSCVVRHKKFSSKTSNNSHVQSRKLTELRRYKLENHPRPRREEISDNYFLLGSLDWSAWQLVISPTVKGKCCHPRAGMKTGYRTKQPFIGSIRGGEPALYEIAVQPKARCRKYVVNSKCFSGRGNWERSLLGTKKLTAQIEAVLKKGSEVYARRAGLKGAGRGEGEVKAILDEYDYAWSVDRSQRTSHRPLTKAGVDISEEIDV